jgi:hypothetical protein
MAAEDMIKELETRVTSLEIDHRVTKEVMGQRLTFVENSVLEHMRKEDADFQEVKEMLVAFDARLRSVDKLIEERIQACRADMINKNREVFATQVDMARLGGKIESNTRTMQIVAGVITVGIAVMSFFFQFSGGAG